MGGPVEQYYNFEYDEWDRLKRHKIEYEMTKRIMKRYIPERATILDVGGGPGRYSIFLAQRGHRVTLVDLCENLVQQAILHAKEADVQLNACIQGNILELNQLPLESEYDVILCMGPIYHLLEEAERIEAINQCLGLLKKNGILMVAFISAYAPIIACLRTNLEDVGLFKNDFLGYLQDGRYRSDPKQGFTDAYFTNPNSIEAFMAGFGLKTVSIQAVENLGIMAEEKLMQLPEDVFQDWLDVMEKISTEPAIWGSSEHLLYIGKKGDL